MLVTRRQVIKTCALAVPAFAMMPAIFRRGVAASLGESRASPAASNKRTLILVQMAGGNDGLNAVVPYSDGRYYDARPNIAIPQNQVLTLNDKIGLHPGLAKFKALWDEGVLGIVQGVGYPNPNYSHFSSMHIWETADPEEKLKDGWLGRYFQQLDKTHDDLLQGLAVGSVVPPEMYSSAVSVPILQSVDLYKIQGDPSRPEAVKARTDALVRLYDASPKQTPYSVLLDNTLEAFNKSVKALRQANAAYKPAVIYPNTYLGKGLSLLAEAIVGDLGIKVGHIMLGGFDTHDNEARDLDRLYPMLSEAIYAFYQDLRAQGKDKEVVIMTWSEFGRRVKSNASDGTDHGSAAPTFIIGTPVKKGLYGEMPNLGNLDNGNLRYAVDFRCVYSTDLNRWLDAPAKLLLGNKEFEQIPFLA